MRREFSAKIKDAALKRCKGRCEGCTASLGPGNTFYDHRIADALDGEPTLENCDVLCKTCHDLKTTKHDVPAIAKAKRRKRQHHGIRRSKRPMLGSKASGWKHKMDRTWVKRRK